MDGIRCIIEQPTRFFMFDHNTSKNDMSLWTTRLIYWLELPEWNTVESHKTHSTSKIIIAYLRQIVKVAIV